jgi:hypothetical protein
MQPFQNKRAAGWGLKRELITQIQAQFGKPEIAAIDFLEIAPENWIGAGGKAAKGSSKRGGGGCLPLEACLTGVLDSGVLLSSSSSADAFASTLSSGRASWRGRLGGGMKAICGD